MTDERLRLQPMKALGELALIVTGVLIALGAESVWETHREQRRAEAYLEALTSDMAFARAQVDTLTAATQAQLEVTARLLEGLRSQVGGARLLEPDSHALGGVLILPTGTLSALLETGDVNLLAPDIRAAVVETHALLRRAEGLTDEFRVAALENLVRYLEVREGLGLNVGRSESISVEEARRAPRLISSVETHRFLLQQRLVMFGVIRASLDDIMAVLAAR